jgi:hypothetical protein
LLDKVDEDEIYYTSSSFIMAEFRPGLPQAWFAGRIEHRLRRVGASFEIVLKCVRLINCDAPLPALAVPF